MNKINKRLTSLLNGGYLPRPGVPLAAAETISIKTLCTYIFAEPETKSISLTIQKEKKQILALVEKIREIMSLRVKISL